MEQEKKVYVNRQIAVLKTGNYLVELVDNLKPAASHFTAHLHAMGDKYTDATGKAKRDESSLIQIFMRDYSNKDGESTAVYMNLEPERIRWYHNWVSLGVKEYQDFQEKIFGKPDEEGYSIVTKIKVSRQDIYNGQKKNRPWSILVENGKGIKQEHPNGGISCKSGSFVPLKRVAANLTDYEFYTLMTRGVKYLDAMENRYMLKPMMKDLLNQLFLAFKGLLVKSFTSSDQSKEAVEAAKAMHETEQKEEVKEELIKEPDLLIVSVTPSTEVCDPYEDEPDLPYFPKPVQNAEPPAVPTQNVISKPNVVVDPKDGEMSYEEACATVINFGSCKGKTMGSLVTENPAQLHWFVKSYKGKNEKLKIAAEILLKTMKAA